MDGSGTSRADRITRLYRSGRDAGRRLRADLTPGTRAWRGAVLGTMAGVTIGLAAAGSVLSTGRGQFSDAALAVAVGWLGIGLLSMVLLGAGWMVRGIPRRVRVLGLAGTLVLGAFLVLPASPGGLAVAALFLVGSGLVGGAVGGLVPPRPSGRRLGIAFVALAVGLAAVVVVPAWLWWSGAEPTTDPLTASGPHDVTILTYGTGDHRHREAFGTNVDVRTTHVVGTPFLGGWTGWRGALRSRYWGFGPDELPLNATVWLPRIDEPAPLVLIVHGNHPMEAPSDEGYGWLAEDLASRGFVVASVDQTFLNLSITRGLDLGNENDARAWLLLEHLRLWRAWNADPASRLHGAADLDRIALIGHSRGGEAVAHAAHFDGMARYPEDATVAFDAGFGIDAVVAIAPTDGQYEPAGRPTHLEDVDYLTLHGGRDGDVASFVGQRQYDRAAFTGDRFVAKAAVFLEDANHGQFNTVWGRRDFPGIAGRTLQTAPLVAGDDQRRDARAAITAMLESSLRDDRSGLALLQDGTHPGWTGTTRVLTRYTDSTHVVLADFDEDDDPATGTLTGTVLEGRNLRVWREGPIPLRWGGEDANGVTLGWNRSDGTPASFTVEIPDGIDLGRGASLLLDFADAVDELRGGTEGTGPPDLSVEVVDAAGRIERTTVGRHGGIPSAPAPRRLKPPLPDPFPSVEAMSRTVRVPLAHRPRQIHHIRLVFDGITAGAVRLDRIAVAP